MAEWGLLTNHARVLVCIARDQRTRLRDIAACADITERAAQGIVRDLVEAGYVTRHRVGTRSFYELHPDRVLHRPVEAGLAVGDLLRPLIALERSEDDDRRVRRAA